MSLDEHKRRQRAQQVALFRYQLICPALDPGLSTKARPAGAGPPARTPRPFGGPVWCSRATLDRWIRGWRAGGFDALVPRRRPGAATGEVLELAAALKREAPGAPRRRSRGSCGRIGWAPSERTLQRHFHRLELNGPAPDGSRRGVRPVRGRGPQRAVGRRRAARAAGRRPQDLPVRLPRRPFPADGRLPVRLRRRHRAAGGRAAAGAGLPRRPGPIYVDNGSSFRIRGCCAPAPASGSGWCTPQPGQPQGRGKIERFFRTVRDQFLVEVADTTTRSGRAGVDPAAALLELNALFTAWVETVYHHRVHSETGQTPLARWDAGWEGSGRRPAMASPAS